MIADSAEEAYQMAKGRYYSNEIVLKEEAGYSICIDVNLPEQFAISTINESAVDNN